MKDGFIKVACVTPKLEVADVGYNTDQIIAKIGESVELGAKLVVFPELCLTGSTAADLFFQKRLLSAAEEGLAKILKASENLDAVIFVGLPFNYLGKNYNVAAVVNYGKLLGLIPKTYFRKNNQFAQDRQFVPGNEEVIEVEFCGQKTLFGKNILFGFKALKSLIIGVEIGADLWAMNPPSDELAKEGATVVVNLNASNEMVGESEYRKNLIKMQSAKLVCGYVQANAGQGESTTDAVYAGRNYIAENGKILAESEAFSQGIIASEIDTEYLIAWRTRYNSFEKASGKYLIKEGIIGESETTLSRTYPKTPFIPSVDKNERFELILQMQATALAKRVKCAYANSLVLGISGGLDSALALLVSVRTKEILLREGREIDVYGITMPCFGTSNRTLNNAKILTRELGAKCIKISIMTAVNRHLSDIKHAKNVFDVTYENAQARERTQVLMDYANEHNGLVVGTGDMSELALGWATYNGDHMSMYSVNCSVPKTLVKHLVAYEGYRRGGVIAKVLFDILDTPISPELLPTDGEKLVQITEDKVGPYILHDFFLYFLVHYGFPPKKVLRLAEYTFSEEFDKETIQKWLKVFIKRFFAQQFKRSCVPDGVKIGSVSLSPRGDWKMPSDSKSAEWLADLEK